jgi:folylpolyglutamate synthase/dihydropteroate synthase
VFAVMADKAWPAMLAPLLPRVACAIVTRVGRRGADAALLAAALAERVPAEAIADPRAAVRAALARARPAEAIVVTGSLFLVGEAYAELAGPGGAGALFESWHAAGSSGTEAAP